MPRDGGGTYTLPAGNPVIPGTIIDTTWANPTMDDIAAALTDSLSRTGSGGMIVPFLNADGVVNLPGISWANQQNMGFYRPGLDEMRVSVAANDKARWTSSSTDPYELFISSMWVPVMHEAGDYSPTGDWDWSGVNSFVFPPVILLEQTVADASVATFGQFWVRDDAPNVPMFTDDDGTDFILNLPDVTPGVVTNSLLRWTGSLWSPQDEVQVSSAGVLLIWDSSFSGNVAISHNGTDLNITHIGTTDWNITSLTNINLFGMGIVATGVGSIGSFAAGLNTDGALGVGDGVDNMSTSMIAGAVSTIGTGGVSAWELNIRMHFASPFYMVERVAATFDQAGFGQFWVRNDSPNTPMFTDDAGNDFDLSAGSAAVFRGARAYSSSIIFAPNNVAPTFTAGDVPQEAAVPLNQESFDTDSIHNTVSNNSRLNVPAGVTQVRLTAGMTVNPEIGGLHHLRIRKNGSYAGIDASHGTMVPHMTIGASGSGSQKGMHMLDGGVINCVDTDYFEIYILGQNNNTDTKANTIWFQMEIVK